MNKYESPFHVTHDKKTADKMAAAADMEALSLLYVSVAKKMGSISKLIDDLGPPEKLRPVVESDFVEGTVVWWENICSRVDPGWKWKVVKVLCDDGNFKDCLGEVWGAQHFSVADKGSESSK